MECDICQRSGSGQLPFNCEFCAQGAIYQPRIALVNSLLENERLEQKVEHQILPPGSQNTSFLGQKTLDTNIAWALERFKADELDSQERTQNILSHTKALREEIRYMRVDLAKRKAHLAKRRKDMTSAQEKLSKGRNSRIAPIQADMSNISQQWESLHKHTVATRSYHCVETAKLLSLQEDDLSRGASGKVVYSIGFTPLPDLRELNNILPAPLTTTLLHLATLVHLTAHHLSLKLPAQIILPSSSYPYPAILSPNVSYSNTTPSLPGFDSQHPLNTTSAASRHTDWHTQPRARPLFTKKQLSILAKEDPRHYALTVEGITLLAWDIAWLCRTQGIDTGPETWESVCAMGRNLWLLLLGSSPAADDNTGLRAVPSNVATAKSDEQPTESPPKRFFSHDTAYGYLGSPQGAEYMARWRLSSPIKVIDRVKERLLAERTGAEWEILEGTEWRNEEAEAERIARMDRIEGSFAEKGASGLEETGILATPHVDGVGGREDERGKEGSGWMKVRGR